MCLVQGGSGLPARRIPFVSFWCYSAWSSLDGLVFLDHGIDLVATFDNLEYYNPCAMSSRPIFFLIVMNCFSFVLLSHYGK